MDTNVPFTHASLSRRALLTKGVVAVGVAALPSRPDAELLALGAEYESLITASCDWPGGDGMPEEIWNRIHDVERDVVALEAQTLAGVAVKLRMLWSWYAEDRTECLYGAQHDSDDRAKMFWDTIQSVNAMSSGRQFRQD